MAVPAATEIPSKPEVQPKIEAESKKVVTTVVKVEEKEMKDEGKPKQEEVKEAPAKPLPVIRSMD